MTVEWALAGLPKTLFMIVTLNLFQGLFWFWDWQS